MIKGSEPRTEHYSNIQPEIHVPGSPQGGKNQALLDTLAAADLVVIAGEASSHCVLETVEDLVNEFSGQPGMLEKFLVLQDCTSPVAHPEIDFGALAEQRLAVALGLRLANSRSLPCNSPCAHKSPHRQSPPIWAFSLKLAIISLGRPARLQQTVSIMAA